MAVSLEEFEGVFPKLVQDLLAHCKQNEAPENIINWLENVRKKYPKPILSHNR